MSTRTISRLGTTILLFAWAIAIAQPATKVTGQANAIVTGGNNGTYFAMARDLANYAAPGLEARESKGSWENIFRLADEPGVSFAMVQSDVLGYFNQWIKSQPGHASVRSSVASLRVMLPLHQEEVHVLVPRGSKLKYLHELRGQRIFMGRPGSGPFITGHQMYRTMFGEEPNAVPASDFKLGEPKLEIEAALMVLAGAGTGPAVDAVLLVGGQPFGAVQTLERRKETAAQYKFLAADARHAATQKLMRYYLPATLDAQHYPELLRGTASPNTLSVQAYLVTVQLSDPKRRRFVDDFADNYCRRFDDMVADTSSHPKWKSVTWKPGSPFPKLAEGWRSVPAGVVSRLTRCAPPPHPSAARIDKSRAAKQSGDGVCVPHPTIKGKCVPS